MTAKILSARRLAASLAVVLPLVGPGTLAHADSLTAVLSDAYQGNATILAQRLRLRQTDEGLPEALAGWRPSVSLSGSIARAHQYFGLSFPGTTPIANLTPSAAALQVQQPLYHGGAIEAGITGARAAIDGGQATLLAVEAAGLLDAATAYLDVFRDGKLADLSQGLVEVLTLNRHDVRVTYDAGAATETDAAQAEARLQGAIAGKLAAAAQLATSRARFLNAVGREAGPLDPPASLGPLAATEAEAAGLAAEHNPDIEAARHALDQARSSVDAATAALLPKLDAVGIVQHADDYLLKGIRQNQAQIGLQAIVPLYEGADYARIRAAREGVAAAEKQQLATERQVRQTISAAWNALQAARAQQEEYRAEIAANQVALNDTVKEVAAGTRTRLDLLNAEQELFGSRVALVGAEHDALLAGFRLQAAEGVFTPSGLGLDTPDYDPARHAQAVGGKWWGTTPPE
jgi:outer membrane protein